jgi:DNA repair protein RecN (Recombination protein N)
VRDLATVADVTLDLAVGLNVLTGERKSMLVDALALLLGDRADRAAVRPGASRLVVEGEFVEPSPALDSVLAEAGLDRDDVVVVRREVSREGRSRAWINGSPTTIGVLAEVGTALVDLHGQHQTLALTDTSTQRDLLDRHADAEAALVAVREAHRQVAAGRAAINELTERRDEALRRADWLGHVVREIDEAHLRPGEEEELATESRRLAQAGTLDEHARRIAGLLGGEDGVGAPLGGARRALDGLARLDPAIEGWRSLLDDAWASLDELARLAAEYADDISDDPDRLTEIERRREVIRGLCRKHGATIADVLEMRREAAAELDLIDHAAMDLEVRGRELAEAERQLAAAAALLTTLRTDGATRLAGEVSRMLPGLGLAGAEFVVDLEPLPEATRDGAEQVVFLARLNTGMPARPIASAASGGERSRLMLALKVAVARHDAAPTLVFDEIDQGIGGETGLRVGAALERVAARHQVLVITHLAQIAARADRHLRVAKGTHDGVATSDLSVLHGEDRMIEVARMLGGADDPHARRLAASMIAGSQVSG